MTSSQTRTNPLGRVVCVLVMGVVGWSGIRSMVAPRKALADPKQATMAAAVPLFASGRIENSGSFHRVGFAMPVAASEGAQFRDPEVIGSGAGKRVLTITKRLKPLPIEFSSPRQAWRHLTEKSRRDIDKGLGQGSKGTRLVFHGSASKEGGAAQLDRLHRQAKGLRGGLAYHFVIGNGTQTGDGAVEVGTRWLAGKSEGGLTSEDAAGASISVCFIGDFHSAGPSNAQLEALDELVDYLTVKVGPLTVLSHRELEGGEVSCLGPFFPDAQIMDALAASQSAQ